MDLFMEETYFIIIDKKGLLFRRKAAGFTLNPSAIYKMSNDEVLHD